MKLSFYRMGTSELEPIYANAARTTSLTNPVVVNTGQSWPFIYLDAAKVYRVVLEDDQGKTLVEADPYLPGTITSGSATFETNGFLNLLDAVKNVFRDTASALAVVANNTLFSVITGCHRAVYRKSGTAAVLLYSYPVPAELSSWSVGASSLIRGGMAETIDGRQMPSATTGVVLDAPNDGMTDAGPAIQALHNALAAQGHPSAIVQVPPGTYLINSPVVIDECAMMFVGNGFNVGPDIESGTWFKITNSAIVPFTFAGLSSRGSGFSNVAFVQDHPGYTAGVAWNPTNYDYIIKCNDMRGEFFIENVYAPRCNKFIYTYLTGRVRINGIYGQFFGNIANISNSYDVCTIMNVHAWTYWTSANEIIQYQQENASYFKLGWVDSVFVDKVFGFGCLSVFRFYNENDQNGNPRSTTKFTAGSIVGDFCKFAILVQAHNVTGDISILNSQHERWPSTGAPIAGACSIYASDPSPNIPDQGARFSVATHHVQRLPGPAIRMVAANGVIDVGRAFYEMINQDGESGAVHTAENSIVRFAIPPTIINSGNCPIVSPGSSEAHVSLQHGVPPEGVNFMRAYASKAGVGPSFGPIGSDANIDVHWGTQGNGVHRFVAQNKQVMVIDNVNNQDRQLIVRPGTDQEMSLIASGPNTNENVSVGAKGVDGTVRLKVNGNIVARVDQVANGNTTLLIRRQVNYVELAAETALTNVDSDIVVSPRGAGCLWIPDGSWNKAHLRLGNYHLWVDSTGDLRIKGTAPTSDTDGTVVGTQS